MPEYFLHERTDFKALVETVADGEKINDPALVEKDYWIMHAVFGLLVWRITFSTKGRKCRSWLICVSTRVLSLFKAHTEVIRKGKAHKPNEFGRLVRIDEVENGIVSGCQVFTGNPADTTAWIPALQQ